MRTCIDINECVELIPCRQGETCVNTLGSYSCLSSINAAAAAAAVQAAIDEEDLAAAGANVGFAGMTVPGVIIGALLGVVATALIVIIVVMLSRAVRGRSDPATPPKNITYSTRRDSTSSDSTATSGESRVTSESGSDTVL